MRVIKLAHLITIWQGLNSWNVQREISVHDGDVTMGAIASQITSLTIVYSTFYSDADQRKHQSSASLAFVRGIHRRPVNSPHKWPITRQMFPFDDVIMINLNLMKCVDCLYIAEWYPPGLTELMIGIPQHIFIDEIWWVNWECHGQNTRAPSQYKDCFAGMGVFIIKIRRLWDRFMGNSILVRRHFHIEIDPDFILCHNLEPIFLSWKFRR